MKGQIQKHKHKFHICDKIFNRSIHTLKFFFRRIAGRKFFFALLCLCTFVPFFFFLIFTVKPSLSEAEEVSGESSGDLIRQASPTREDDPFSEISFPTIYKTGLDICTNSDGRPVVFMFSSSSCSHCEWSGEIFDFIVKYYTAGGLIEAHHYDMNTGDDLLTEEIETEIPPLHLQIKEHGDPKGLVPYFNFSCKYERIGNGYEKENDMTAEGAEIRQAIDTLIQMLPKDE